MSNRKDLRERLEKAAEEFPIIGENPQELFQEAAEYVASLEKVVEAGVDWYASQDSKCESSMSVFPARGLFYSLAVLAGFKAKKREEPTSIVYQKEEDKD